MFQTDTEEPVIEVGEASRPITDWLVDVLDLDPDGAAAGVLGAIVEPAVQVLVVLAVSYVVIRLLRRFARRLVARAKEDHPLGPLGSELHLGGRAPVSTRKRQRLDALGAVTDSVIAVVVWVVENTAEAVFDVDDYEGYVTTQSESAVRHLATQYPYDSEDDTLSLRGDIDTVSGKLEMELAERLGRAGVKVIEARLSHLAYAPEIAGAMLRRQQADAIIAARFKIVEGAVGMVENALDALGSRGIVELDDERRAAMVSNLMVVLCGQEEAHPIINAGSLY